MSLPPAHCSTEGAWELGVQATPPAEGLSQVFPRWPVGQPLWRGTQLSSVPSAYVHFGFVLSVLFPGWKPLRLTPHPAHLCFPEWQGGAPVARGSGRDGS